MTGRGTSPATVPVEQLRAMIRLLWPSEITPTAKRQLEAVCEQAEERSLSSTEEDTVDVPCPHDPTGTSPYACACEDG